MLTAVFPSLCYLHTNAIPNSKIEIFHWHGFFLGFLLICCCITNRLKTWWLPTTTVLLFSMCLWGRSLDGAQQGQLISAPGGLGPQKGWLEGTELGYPRWFLDSPIWHISDVPLWPFSPQQHDLVFLNSGLGLWEGGKQKLSVLWKTMSRTGEVSL